MEWKREREGRKEERKVGRRKEGRTDKALNSVYMYHSITSLSSG